MKKGWRVGFALAVVSLGGALGRAQAPAAAAPADRNYPSLSWRIDPEPVLTRGPIDSLDARVVGDPCIVWDEPAGTWRMFYFASGLHPETKRRGPRTAMAIARSPERVGPGDWTKLGLVSFTNPEALINPDDFHKWWVVMDARRPNQPVRIDGRYWAVFTASIRLHDGRMHKHLQAASAEALAGPWTLRAQPILAPGEGASLDALHADAPTAFWLEDRQRVLIYYMAYPVLAQTGQPRAPFGSGTMAATWHPREEQARKEGIAIRAGTEDGWNQGWMASIQLVPAAGGRSWYGLYNASPTPPADRSHREPAPSLGGWVVCDGDPLNGRWRADLRHSPFRRPEQLTAAERAAGLDVNFWRHHLLVTAGAARIFFNSGPYGSEQMYSLIADD